MLAPVGTPPELRVTRSPVSGSDASTVKLMVVPGTTVCVVPQVGAFGPKDGATLLGGQLTISIKKSMATCVLKAFVEASLSSIITWQEYNPPSTVAVVSQLTNPVAELIDRPTGCEKVPPASEAVASLYVSVVFGSGSAAGTKKLAVALCARFTIGGKLLPGD